MESISSSSRSLLFIALAFILVAGSASAQDSAGTKTPPPAPTIRSYTETVDLHVDGNAIVTVEAHLSTAGLQQIDLPLNFSNPTRMTAKASAPGVSAAPGRNADTRVIKLAFDSPPQSDVKATITFNVEKFINWDKARNARGLYKYSYVFLNTTPTRISNYLLHVMLPPSYLINGITSSNPRNTGEQVEPSFLIGDEANRVVVTLRSKTVAPSGNAAITFLFQSDAKPLGLVITICLLLGAAALYLKRDVLTRPDYKPEVSA